MTCSECGGTRLCKEALAVKINGKSITDVSRVTIEGAAHFFGEEIELSEYELSIGKLLLREIRSRLKCLVQIGLGYLTLDRLTRTLSGGEMQRVNLATSLGSALVNTLDDSAEPAANTRFRSQAVRH